MTKTVSYHAQVERQERISFIIDATKGEFGKMICSVSDSSNNTKRVLTEKGIIIILDNDTERLVTMYFGTVAQITQLYRSATKEKTCPKWVMKIAHKAKEYNLKQP